MDSDDLPDLAAGVPGRRHPAHWYVVFAALFALLCGLLAAAAAWRADARDDAEAAAHRHRVVATTTDRSVIIPETRYAASPTATAPARWEYPVHTRRSGTVHVRPDTAKGTPVEIWVDDAGAYRTRPAFGLAQRGLTSAAFGIVVTGLVALAEGGGLLLARRRALNRRLDAWEREWEALEPVWTGRRPRDRGPDDGTGPPAP
ncbi:Rv1733c family protein [Streptomyces sp. NPDC001478]